jgi:TPR repeat protein
MIKKVICVVILLGGLVLIQACVQLRNEKPARYCVASEAFRVAMGLPSDEALSVAGLTAVHGMAEGDPFYQGTNAVWAVPDRVAIEKLAQKGNPWAQFTTGWFHDYGVCGAERNYFKAFDFYRAAAKKGYTDAYGDLGWLYLNGQGVPQNTDLAKATFEKGVAAGSPKALSGLGYMYLYGVGVKTDYALARKLFEQGAVKGFAHSEYHIGIFHDWGYGCSINRQEAKKWFLSAARKGYHKAQYALGTYLWAEGNKEEALSWFRLAARQGNLTAMVKLLRTLAEESSPLCNLQESFHWALRLAEKGSPEGVLLTSMMYSEGEGVEKNMEEALRWRGMVKVLNSGGGGEDSGDEHQGEDDGITPEERYIGRPIDDAQLELGMAYGRGEGLKQDEMQALRWLTLAANNQNRDAQRMLGASLFYGHSGVTNKTDGLRWLKLAVAQNDLIGMFHLGIVYLDETSDSEDDEEGLHWLHQAAKRGLPEAQFFLGGVYLVGRSFIESDPIRAEAWLSRSAEQGLPEAIVQLAEAHLKGTFKSNPVIKQQVLEASALTGCTKHQLALGTFFLQEKRSEALGLYWLARAWVIGGNQDAKRVFLKNKTLYEKYQVDVRYRLQEDAEDGDEEAKKVIAVLTDMFAPAKKELKKSGSRFEKR